MEVVEGGGSEPGVGSVDGEVVDGRAEAAAGAPVGGENARYGVIEALLDEQERTVVKVERGGAPEVAPPGREDLGAGAVLGGEEGDDGAEDVIGEFADEIPVADELAIPVPRPAPLGRGFRRLLLPLHAPRLASWRRWMGGGRALEMRRGSRRVALNLSW